MAIFGFFIETPAQLHARLVLALAEQPDGVQHLFRVEVVADNLTILADVDHVERMNAVPVVFIHAVVDAVSYTHLDVYKRQEVVSPHSSGY